MTPSIDDRIATMITALEKTILPALAEADSIAREQARLLLGHLGMIRQQVDHESTFDRVALRQQIGLATKLIAYAAGGAATSAAVGDLNDAIRAGNDARIPSDIRDAQQGIDQAIEALVHAARRDGAPGCLARVSRDIIDHVEIRTSIDRAWFAGAGFDAAVGFPSIDELMREMYEN